MRQAAFVLASLALVGALPLLGAPAPTPRLIAVRSGFRVPECVVVDPQTGFAYVSNIDSAPGAYWADDGKGFISRLAPDGRISSLRWRQSTRDVPLNAPKGMCILGRTLYVADNTRVVTYPLGEGAPRVIAVPGARHLNDMATDGRYAYVSDTENACVYRLASGGRGPHLHLRAPNSVNGITFRGGRMYAVSWNDHDLYEMDPSGKRPPRALGRGAGFKNLDGIEVLADGSFLVSDFTGNRVAIIAANRSGRTLEITVDSPADIGWDAGRHRLYVPQFMKDRVAIYELPGR